VPKKGEVKFESEGAKLCLINTEVIMLKDGQILFSGSDEALRSSDDAYIHKFIRGK
jgi:ABC-type transporter Mla maintaining outer membrane lipid asymmetry ATPase subunit MlaF